MCNQQVLSFPHQVSDESSSLGLSQDTDAILHQGDSQAAMTEQQASTSRIPFQHSFSLHGAGASIADRAQNIAFFHEIDEVLNSDV
jgi:hypothetical protein